MNGKQTILVFAMFVRNSEVEKLWDTFAVETGSKLQECYKGTQEQPSLILEI